MMASTLFTLIAVLFFVAAVVLVVMGLRRRSRGGAEETPRRREDPFRNVTGAHEFGPEVLGPGAIITRGATDYVVRGTVTVTQGYYTWYEHMLEGGHGSEWLSSEVDEGRLNLSWWTSRGDLDVQPAARVTVEGVEYRRTESGDADFTTEGETGLPPRGRLSYYDLEATDGSGRLLGLERFGDGAWEASVGREVLPGELTVYPAPKQ